MQLQDLLFSQGFGTRRICAGLVQQGHVRVGAETVTDPGLEVEAKGFRFEVDGVSWEFHEKAYLMLNKPANVECSQKPENHESVFSFFPEPFL